MQQTPAHEAHNPGLLSLLPEDSKGLIEVGCSTGALAREYKQVNSKCVYTGIEIDSEFAKLARRYCDVVLNMDIETADENFFQSRASEDCWIFGDTLEYLRDPWLILSRMPIYLSCIPEIPKAKAVNSCKSTAL